MEEDVIASYTVEITIRGQEGAKTPTNKEIEELIESNFDFGEITVRAVSERTDR
jgi:hypothetical protein